MTEKQRDYISSLNTALKEDLNLFESHPEEIVFADDMLGENWIDYYKSITNERTSEVIQKLKEQLSFFEREPEGWEDIPFGVDFDLNA